jgi:hypothetical protein
VTRTYALIPATSDTTAWEIMLQHTRSATACQHQRNTIARLPLLNATGLRYHAGLSLRSGHSVRSPAKLAAERVLGQRLISFAAPATVKYGTELFSSVLPGLLKLLCKASRMGMAHIHAYVRDWFISILDNWFRCFGQAEIVFGVNRAGRNSIWFKWPISGGTELCCSRRIAYKLSITAGELFHCLPVPTLPG